MTALYLGRVPQTNQVLVTDALHRGFWALAIMTVLSAAVFWRLRKRDGDSISRGRATASQAEPVAQ